MASGVQAAERSDPPVAASARPARGSTAVRPRRWRSLRRHRLFLGALLLGATLRLVVALAYQPALWFQGDSFSYLARGVDLVPGTVRPPGYDILLRALDPLPHSLTLLTAAQHVAGLGVAGMVYALLVHRSVPAWLATAATLPVLLDAYQLQLEHLVMSDTLHVLLTTAGVVLLAWGDRLSWPAAAAGGLLLGAAAVTRSVGLPVALLLLALTALRRVGLARTLAAALACALSLTAHLVWFHAEHGRWAFTNSSGIFLYSRTMAFADCAVLPLSAEERRLCDPRPPQARPESSRFIWSPDSPLPRLPGARFTEENDRLAQRFALTAVRHQPGDYVRVVAHEVGYAFAPGRPPVPAQDLAKYEFVRDPSTLVTGRARKLRTVQAYDDSVTSLNTAAHPRLAAFLDRYQDVVRLPGPALAVLLVLALAALRPGARHRGAALTLLAGGAALFVLPPMTAQYDPRYVLAAVPLLSAAAALGTTGLVRRATAQPGAAGGREHRGQEPGGPEPDPPAPPDAASGGDTAPGASGQP